MARFQVHSRTPLSFSLVGCLALGALTVAPSAMAQGPDGAPDPEPQPEALAEPAQDGDGWDGDYDIKSKRRSDFMFTLTGGLMVAAASGYPNDVDKIDDPAFRANTGAAPGGVGTGVLGVAFRDWLSFGVGYAQSVFNGSGHQGSAWLIMFRTEAFPLFGSSPIGEDLGFAVSGGIGNLKLEKDGETTTDGGAVSMLGVGAFWEGLRMGSLSAGPAVDYQYVFSKSVNAHLTTLGLRGSFYGGP